ncbi:MAG: hypothetical protein AAF499_03815 [Pseudomonadota bacterium]
MTRKHTTALVFALSCFAFSPAHAGIIKMPDGSLRAQQVEGAPKPGRTKADVLSQLGEPEQRIGEVGDPPISSWRYDGFQVYFEHNLVLHTVGF